MIRLHKTLATNLNRKAQNLACIVLLSRKQTSNFIHFVHTLKMVTFSAPKLTKAKGQEDDLKVQTLLGSSYLTEFYTIINLRLKMHKQSNCVRNKC